jgi:hypothetical protein
MGGIGLVIEVIGSWNFSSHVDLYGTEKLTLY